MRVPIGDKLDELRFEQCRPHATIMRLAKGHNPVKARSQHSPNFSGHQLLQLNCGGEAPPPHEPAIFAPGIDLLTRIRIDPHPASHLRATVAQAQTTPRAPARWHRSAYAEITDDGMVRHPVFRALHDLSRNQSVDDGRANARNLGLSMPLSS